MSLLFRFKIDDVATAKPPVDWENFSISLVYDPDIRGRIIRYPSQLAFDEVDYQTLYDVVTNNSLCNPLVFKVEYSTNSGGTYATFFEANMEPSDIEFDIGRNRATTRVRDITFSALIYNNRDTVVPISASESKSGTSITPPDPQIAGSFSSLTPGFNGFLYLEVMQHILDYITDDQVDLQDNWYPTIQDEAAAGWTRELMLQCNSGGTDLQNSFTSLWVSIARLYNLNFSLVNNSGTIEFTVDEEDDYYSSTSAFTMSAFTAFSINIEESKLYSRVRVGDTASDRTLSNNQFNPFEYEYDMASSAKIYNVQEFATSDQCKANNALLDLTSQLSYVTQDAYGGVPKETSRITFVDINDTSGLRTLYSATLDKEYTIYRSQPPSPEDSLIQKVTNAYPSLQNNNILARYSFVNDLFVARALSPAISCVAKLSANQSFTGTDELEDVDFLNNATGSSDPRTSWSNTDHAFYTTCFDEFVYTLSVEIDLHTTYISGSGQVKNFLVYNSGGTDYYLQVGDTMTSAGSYNHNLTVELNVFGPNHSIRVQTLGATGISYRINFTASEVDISGVDDDGEIIRAADASNAKVWTVNLEGSCTISEWAALMDDPRKNIACNIYDDPTIKGWVDDLTFVPAKGTLSGRMITDHANLVTA